MHRSCPKCQGIGCPQCDHEGTRAAFRRSLKNREVSYVTSQLGRYEDELSPSKQTLRTIRTEQLNG